MASHCNHSAARRRYDVSPATGGENENPVLPVDDWFHAVDAQKDWCFTVGDSGWTNRSDLRGLPPKCPPNQQLIVSTSIYLRGSLLSKHLYNNMASWNAIRVKKHLYLSNSSFPYTCLSLLIFYPSLLPWHTISIKLICTNHHNIASLLLLSFSRFKAPTCCLPTHPPMAHANGGQCSLWPWGP